MMLGAEGVLMGTRFYASVEAEANPAAKQRIVAAQSGDSVRSAVFDIARRIPWPQAYTGRALRNRLTERWVGREEAMRAEADALATDYAAARARGDLDIAGVFAGEAAAMIHDIPPAAGIVARVVAQAAELLGRRVPVLVEKAGPYALVGRLAGPAAE